MLKSNFGSRPRSSSPHVKAFALYMIAVVCPLVIMTLVNLVTLRSWWDFHNGSSYAYAPQRTHDVCFLNLATLGGMFTLVYFDWL